MLRKSENATENGEAPFRRHEWCEAYLPGRSTKVIDYMNVAIPQVESKFHSGFGLHQDAFSPLMK